jgi:hypothetical protein
MSMPTEMIMDASARARAGLYWREKDGVRALVCAPLEQDGFTNAFSTRLGGVSPMPLDSLNLAGFNEDEAENIYENRRRFLRLFDGDWTLTGCCGCLVVLAIIGGILAVTVPNKIKGAEAIPEFNSSARARRLVRSAKFQRELSAFRRNPLIDYPRQMEARRRVLQCLSEVLEVDRQVAVEIQSLASGTIR